MAKFKHIISHTQSHRIDNCAEMRSTTQYGGDLVTLRNVVALRNVVTLRNVT